MNSTLWCLHHSPISLTTKMLFRNLFYFILFALHLPDTSQEVHIIKLPVVYIQRCFLISQPPPRIFVKLHATIATSEIYTEWDIRSFTFSLITAVPTPFMARWERRPGFWSGIGIVLLLTNTQRSAVCTKSFLSAPPVITSIVSAYAVAGVSVRVGLCIV